MEQVTFTAQELDQIVGYVNRIPTEYGRPLLNFLEALLQKKVQENEQKDNINKEAEDLTERIPTPEAGQTVPQV